MAAGCTFEKWRPPMLKFLWPYQGQGRPRLHWGAKPGCPYRLLGPGWGLGGPRGDGQDRGSAGQLCPDRRPGGRHSAGQGGENTVPVPDDPKVHWVAWVPTSCCSSCKNRSSQCLGAAPTVNSPDQLHQAPLGLSRSGLTSSSVSLIIDWSRRAVASAIGCETPSSPSNSADARTS